MQQSFQRIRTEHHEIGPHVPPYIIAEVGLNHNGSLELALEMSRSARESGASAVKFQLYHSDHFIHASSSLGEGGPGSLREFFKHFELTETEWRTLAKEVRGMDMDFFCSVFDAPSLRLYGTLDPAIVKIASADVDNRLLLEDAARTRLPVLLSTGTATEEEVARAREWLGPETPVLLFQCVSAYPAQPGEFHLRVLPRWIRTYGPLVGLSDHSEGNEISLAAVALGAVALERHFTLDRSLEGPDQKLSLIPSELSRLVHEANRVYESLGDENKSTRPAEEGVRKYGRRSLAAVRSLDEGHRLTREDLMSLRPGGEGIPVSEFPRHLGRRLKRSVDAGAFLREEDLE